MKPWWLSTILCAAGVVCSGFLHGASASVAGNPRAHVPARASDRLAVIVGVGAYPESSGWRPLQGAVRDAERIRDVLTGRFGFTAESIQLLTDRQATRTAILDAFDRMIEQADSNTIVLFYFAGHGSQVPDQSGDESDGLDETIVPFDSTHDNDDEHILDDELGARFDRLATPHVVGIFDCCHSGTAMRNDDTISRFVGRGRSAPPAPAATPPRTLAAVDLGDRPRSQVILTACEDHQEAKERRGRGYFSHALERALLQIQPDATWREVHARIRHHVQRSTSFQTPVLHGAADTRVFDARFEVGERRYSVVRIEKGRIVVEAGRAQGLEVGSRLLLRPFAGSEDLLPRPNREGPAALEVEVEDCGFSQSWGRPLRVWSASERQRVADQACYAELVEGSPSGFELTVSLAPESDDSVQEALTGLHDSPLLRPAAEGELVVNHAEHGYEVHHEGHRIIPHPLRVERGQPDHFHSTDLLLDDLRAYASWNAVRRIQNPSSPLYDRVRVSVNPGWGWHAQHRSHGRTAFEPAPDLWRTGAHGEWQIDMNDVRRRRVQNDDPHGQPALLISIRSVHDQPLYFTGFDLRPDWSVAPLGITNWTLHVDETRELPLYITEDDTLTPGAMPERLKLLFTDRIEDFWVEECRGLRDPEELGLPPMKPRLQMRNDGTVGRLGRLLDHLRGDRRMRAGDTTAEPYLWTSKDVDFSVVPSR